MWFDPAVVEAVRDAFPTWTVFVFAFLSYLGSVWFVAPAVVAAYLFGDRRRFAPWLAIVMGGYAIMVGLKGYFRVDRPGVGPAIDPESLPLAIELAYAPAVEVGTTSFPSGHAIAGTIIWTMIALETDYGSRVTRFAVAATMIVLIAVSRIAVGLHFPIDVAIGVAIACCYLALVLSIREWATEWGTHTATSTVFATVAGIAVLSYVSSGRVDAAALLGGSLGALTVWHYAPPSPDPWPLTADVLGRSLAILALLGVAALVFVTIELVVVWFLIGAVSGAVIVGLPGPVAAVADGRSMRDPTE